MIKLNSRLRRLTYHIPCILRRCSHHAQFSNVPSQLISRYPGLNIDAVTKLCAASKDFDNLETWDRCIDLFSSYGFDVGESVEMMTKNSEILRLSRDHLSGNLQRWATCGIDSHFTKLLLKIHPKLLHLNVQFMDSRLPLVQALRKSPKSLVQLLIACPNLMLEPWEHIKRKLDYLENIARVEKDQIFQSSALSKPLEHLQLRFLILIKCGLFESLSPYEHKRLKSSKGAFVNPHLKRIVDNEDISFARKTAKISYEEYEVFKKMFDAGEFEHEIYSASSDELVSDSDSE